MADEQKPKQRLEIAHVLFMDIVGYSKLLTDEQSEALQELNQIVRNTEAARGAEAAGQLTILPTGDGMALVFSGSVEEPVECALEISHALRAQPSLPVRMGIHSGPVHHVKDANERENIAGIGINIAQRVMDCGDAGHILVSKRVADDLAQKRRWQPYLHELGDVEVKHGVMVSLVNFYAETIGNPAPPARVGKVRGRARIISKTMGKGLSPLARAIFIIVGLLIALIFVLAIVSVIFAPAIMHTLDQRHATSQPQAPAVPSPPQSLADTIKSEVAKKITEELRQDINLKKKPIPKPPPVISGIAKKSIAVFPFANLSHDPDNAYFAAGIQDEIITRLSKIADLKVISCTSTQRFKSSPDDVPAIADQLGVANVLEGSVQRTGDQVRVNVQLIKGATDAHLWADTFDRHVTDIFAVESEIAKTIATTLQAKLTGSEQTAITAQPTENTDAYQLYLKGRFFWNKRTGQNLNKAADYFNQAIAVDPKYALAYVGLADAYLLMPLYGAGAPQDCYPKAKTAISKALELDDKSAEAHASIGQLCCYYELDFPRAVREFQRAIELNPNYPTAHQWYGSSALVSLGRFDEAIAQVKRAIELDPLSFVINIDMGNTLFRSRHYDEAIQQIRKTLEMDPGFYYAHWNLGLTLIANRELSAAIEEFKKARELDDNPSMLGFLAYAYGVSGNKTEAEKIRDELKSLSSQRYVSEFSFALTYLGLGDKEEALRHLQKSYESRAGETLRFIKVDPLLDPLRGDPRFEALAEKIVPAAEFKSATASK
jgi:TolB-like protein/tetratricopeptide (TPR) repeat protein/class 3 adenylate cyclase